VGMHDTEPRDIGYSSNAVTYYQEWIEQKANPLFAGMKQKDLFIFAMALGKHRERKSTIGGKKINNIPVSAITEKEKWAVLPIAISEENDLLCLREEVSIYRLAEEYANEGIKILSAHMEKFGLNYPKKLELELKKLLEEQA